MVRALEKKKSRRLGRSAAPAAIVENVLAQAIPLSAINEETGHDNHAPAGPVMWHDFGPDSPELVRFFQEFTQLTPLFRFRKTSVLLHLDGIDPLAFTALAIPFTKALFKSKKP